LITSSLGFRLSIYILTSSNSSPRFWILTSRLPCYFNPLCPNSMVLLFHWVNSIEGSGLKIELSNIYNWDCKQDYKQAWVILAGVEQKYHRFLVIWVLLHHKDHKDHKRPFVFHMCISYKILYCWDLAFLSLSFHWSNIATMLNKWLWQVLKIWLKELIKSNSVSAHRHSDRELFPERAIAMLDVPCTVS